MGTPRHWKLRATTLLLATGISLGATQAAQAATKICVEVRKKTWAAEPEEQEAPAAGKPKSSEPIGPRRQPVRPKAKNPHKFDPGAYLARMLEYEVTHEDGFEATSKGCAQRITVELYPLADGWTVFARYSGYAREEKVNYVRVDEFAQLAQRLSGALLHDRPIEQTLTRENVLRNDSEGKLRSIGVRGHAIFGMGTSIRAGTLPTSDDSSEGAKDKVRLMTPISLQLGYRGKLKGWGIDAVGRLHLGTREEALSSNSEGGHVDYAGGIGIGLHFFRYLDPPGVTSLYVGGGASFDLSVFTVIREEDKRETKDRDQLIGGGLNLDLVVGYEFLRARALHFYTQMEINAPTYFIRAENSSGGVRTYLPGAAAQIGVIF